MASPEPRPLKLAELMSRSNMSYSTFTWVGQSVSNWISTSCQPHMVTAVNKGKWVFSFFSPLLLFLCAKTVCLLLGRKQLCWVLACRIVWVCPIKKIGVLSLLFLHHPHPYPIYTFKKKSHLCSDVKAERSVMCFRVLFCFVCLFVASCFLLLFCLVGFLLLFFRGGGGVMSRLLSGKWSVRVSISRKLSEKCLCMANGRSMRSACSIFLI